MTIMRVAESGGYVLTYDTDDVEHMKIQCPSDVIDVTKPEDIYIHRELGRAHLHLTVDFKDGKRPLWVKEGEPGLDASLVAQVQRGVAEAERGQTVDRGSFAQYLEDDDD